MIVNPTTYDPSEGIRRANRGTRRVAAHNCEWTDAMKTRILELLQTREELGSDDPELRKDLAPPPNDNCIGAAFRALSNQGQIRVLKVRRSASPQAHGRLVNVWVLVRPEV